MTRPDEVFADRDQQIAEMRQALTISLGADVATRPDLLVVIAEHVDALHAILKAGQQVAAASISRETALAMAEACLRFVAAHDAMRAVGAAISTELFKNVRGAAN